MASRVFLPRLAAPLRAASARAAPPKAVRFNSSSSSSSSSSSTSRVLQMAGQAEKMNPLEAAVPVMWAVSGAFIFAAWSRIDESSVGDNVEKLLIV
ncbi:hypothetical protein BS50DRAFT_640966 [Corynespora cassiicola Philippines]|uniref:Uncharacterized protein n=1 Tax=Corynespora cassiicola Philippines TaxID=1448308 RepID=A0A2T2N1U5_CORCC|nr:hypothetical protein BS50DRAFT_640966 [Corynespora cassiicola Philippines]